MSAKIFDEGYEKEIFELNRNIPNRVVGEDGTLYDTEGNEISLDEAIKRYVALEREVKLLAAVKSTKSKLRTEYTTKRKQTLRKEQDLYYRIIADLQETKKLSKAVGLARNTLTTRHGRKRKKPTVKEAKARLMKALKEYERAKDRAKEERQRKRLQQKKTN
jgi:hypothetical protein